MFVGLLLERFPWTRTSCHSCSISVLIPCPSGYKRTPGSVAQDCRYYVKTASLKLHISGCSFECYREVEVKSCCPGHWGPDCVECPDRPDKPCSERGNCSDGAGGDGTCSLCSCVHGLCDSGLKGDGRCTCFSGYKGPNCDQEVPECAALTCQPNSRCMEEALTGKLVCQCLPGHQKSGDQCLSINPCVQRVCHVQASCVHTGPNQHLCACNEGHSGDGRVCMAIDPCQTRQGGCAAQSTRCVYDGPGKSHCECLPGFDHLSDGGCSLKDSCRPGSCHKNANCSTVGPGRVECTCVQGYIGNGKVCYGNIMQHLNELNTEPGGQWSGQLSSLSWPLQNLGPFTLFVPINKGFRGTSVRTLTADLSKAKYLCKMHLVAGVMPFDTLKKTDVFYTLTGKSAEIDTSEGDTQTKIRIHGSRKRGVIIQSDVVASNGMIHLINKLMDSVSPTVESDPKVQSILTLGPKTELASVMDLPGPITVFAPSTSAFDAMTDGHLTFLSSTEGECVRCSKVKLSQCSSGVYTVRHLTLFTFRSPSVSVQVSQSLSVYQGASIFGCVYTLTFGSVPGNIVATGCSPLCNATVKVKKQTHEPQKHQGPVKGFSGALGHGDTRHPAQDTVRSDATCHSWVGGEALIIFYSEFYFLQCLEGVAENGSCVCDQNFRGSRCQYCSSSNKHGPNCDTTCLCVHGQCDNRPDSNGGCKVDSCLPGFTGRFCDRRTAVCGVQGQFCHAHADCDFSEGTIRCVCKPGYQGDGITCVEADPCAPPLRGGCSVNAKCIKTGAGTRSCQCLTGWREDGDECQPINNCDGPDRGGCHSNATCIYVGPGQSDCSCKSGYQGDGRDCEAVNQCVSVSGGCHHLASCRRLSSQWTCVCDDGYLGDGHLCFGTVEEVSGGHVELLWCVHCLLRPCGVFTVCCPDIPGAGGSARGVPVLQVDHCEYDSEN
uniref:Stabilin 2 n=1 Tax=Scophthalmus maximus TaxID=52904 RepID=A0A8D3AH52_SCOMX